MKERETYRFVDLLPEHPFMESEVNEQVRFNSFLLTIATSGEIKFTENLLEAIMVILFGYISSHSKACCVKTTVPYMLLFYEAIKMVCEICARKKTRVYVSKITAYDTILNSKYNRVETRCVSIGNDDCLIHILPQENIIIVEGMNIETLHRAAGIRIVDGKIKDTYSFTYPVKNWEKNNTSYVHTNKIDARYHGEKEVISRTNIHKIYCNVNSRVYKEIDVLGVFYSPIIVNQYEGRMKKWIKNILKK